MSEYLTSQETQRLIIRQLNDGDVNSWEAFLSDGSPFRYYPKTMTIDKNTAKDWVDRQIRRYEKDGFGLMALECKETGQLVGQCGLIRQQIDGKDELEIGYHIIEEYRTKGYASEAAQYFKHFAFEQLEVKSVISIIHPDNVASQMVASRNGMIKEKTTIWNEMKSFVYRAIR